MDQEFKSLSPEETIKRIDRHLGEMDTLKFQIERLERALKLIEKGDKRWKEKVEFDIDQMRERAEDSIASIEEIRTELTTALYIKTNGKGIISRFESADNETKALRSEIELLRDVIEECRMGTQASGLRLEGLSTHVEALIDQRKDRVTTSRLVGVAVMSALLTLGGGIALRFLPQPSAPTATQAQQPAVLPADITEQLKQHITTALAEAKTAEQKQRSESRPSEVKRRSRTKDKLQNRTFIDRIYPHDWYRPGYEAN